MCDSDQDSTRPAQNKSSPGSSGGMASSCVRYASAE